MKSTTHSDLASIDDARRNLKMGSPRASITGRSWRGATIDRLSGYVVNNMAVGPRDHHLLAINLADHSYVKAVRCGRVYESAGLLGEAAIVPAGEASAWDGRVPPHITVRIPSDAMTEAIAELNEVGLARPQIANHFRIRDPYFESMATIFNAELVRAPHPAQDLLTESLITALTMHLIRGYTDRPWRDKRPLLNVTPSSMRRALNYIEDLPNERISLDDLAAAAGLSRFHFSRVFRKHFGIGPAAYVERSRIERAKKMIRVAQLPLAEIAYAVGFADQSHFTRRFRHYEGCTPSQYASEHARGTLRGKF